MGRFVSTSDVKVLTREDAAWWDEDEQVTIRRWTIGQRDRMNDAILKITGVQAEGSDDVIPDLQVKAAQTPILEAGIKSWTFKDDDGRVVPLSTQNITRLNPRDADFIVSQIREFNRPPDEESVERFQEFGAGGGEGEA